MRRALPAKSSPYWAAWAIWKSPRTAARRRSWWARAKAPKSEAYWKVRRLQETGNKRANSYCADFRSSNYKFPKVSILCGWPGVAFHLGGPSQKPPQVASLAPEKFPKFQEADLLHLDPAIG